MFKNKALAVILPILAIVLIGFVVVKYVMPQPVEMSIKCTECNKTFENAKVLADAAWPVACPECKQKAAVKATIYHDANTKAILYLTDEEYEKAVKTKSLILGKP